MVDGEWIAALGPELEVEVDRVVDATGKYVLPGGIDVHTHLDMPLDGMSSSDDFTSGTIAAAFGGTTVIVNFPTQTRGESLRGALDTWLEKAQGRAAIDYGFHTVISDFNGRVEQEMDELMQEGITSFKLFMAYPDRLTLDDSAIFRALSVDSYEEPGFGGAKYVMSPPLRERDKQVELWRGLARGDLQVVATDHCPFRMADQKEIGRGDFTKIPGGAPGIETRLSLVFDAGVLQNRISLNRFVDITATSPAKTFGLWPQRGEIAPGSYADIVVWDPDKDLTLNVESLHMRVDYSPYEGRTVTGVPELVMARGRVIIEGDRYLGNPGDGEFIKRSGRTT